MIMNPYCHTIFIYFIILLTLVREINSTQCKDLDPNLLQCDYNNSCNYGDINTVECKVPEDIACDGKSTLEVSFPCFYCWQLPEDHYSCAQNTSCKLNSKYLTTCKVNSTTFCLGRREFQRYKLCTNSNGHNWSTALILSFLFGGFGIDRFYLGFWQEGVGKLFSFGGFGVWTLIDAILISIGYLKPHDSNYE